MASLVVTIDTEPDLPRRRQASAGSLSNIPALLTLQERLPEIKLTLLVTYSVVTDPPSLRILERLVRDFDCEIGAHLHPEETPPFVRGRPDETSLARLPLEARAEKLRTLTEAIRAHFPAPVSYRAGRWKLSPEDLGVLDELGYRIDSTVTPNVSWRVEHGPDFTLARAEPHLTEAGVWEVPVTIGLSHGQRLARLAPVRWYLQLASLELLGLPTPLKAAWDLARPIRPIWLRPTYHGAPEMIRLAERELARSPDAVLNMMLHSNELAAGGRPFIRAQQDAERILSRTIETCRYLITERGVSSTTLRRWLATRPTRDGGFGVPIVAPDSPDTFPRQPGEPDGGVPATAYWTTPRRMGMATA